MGLAQLATFYRVGNCLKISPFTDICIINFWYPSKIALIPTWVITIYSWIAGFTKVQPGCLIYLSVFQIV